MKLHLFILMFLIMITAVLQSENRTPLIGAQVFIEPGQSEQQIESWFKLLADHHMPICRIRMFEDHVHREDNSWDFSLYDFAFNMAKKYKVRIIATLFPSDNTVGGFKFPRNNDHLEAISNYIEQTVQHFKDHPALDSWVLQNEPGLGSYPKDDFALMKYKEWKSEHPKTPPKNGFKRTSLDWEMFYRDYTTWYLSWIEKQIRKYDLTTNIHVNNHQLFMILPQYDFPNWMPFLNSLGASIHASWHLKYFKRAQYTLGITANCDIIRAASAPKPFWVTELQGGTNIFSGIYPLCPSAIDITQWLWACIGSGAERVIFWTLNPRATNEEAGEWAMVTYQNEPSVRLVEAGKIANILLKNADLFKQANPVNSDIYLLYSPESMIIFQEKVFSRNTTDEYAGRKQGAHIKSLLAYYEALQEIGIHSQIKQMDHFDWQEKSTTSKIVILPNMISIPSRFIEDIYKYVENGNKLIMTGMTGFFDEYMHNVILSTNPFNELQGAQLKDYKFMNEDFEINLTDPQLILPAHMLKGEIQNISAKVIGKSEDSIIGIRNQYKNGEVVWIPSLIGLGAWQKNNVPLAQFLKIEIEQVVKPIQFCFKSHQPKILLRTLEVNGGFITILINSGNKVANVEFKNKIAMKPEFIFGKQREFSDNIIKISSQETVVINWK